MKQRTQLNVSCSIFVVVVVVVVVLVNQGSQLQCNAPINLELEHTLPLGKLRALDGRLCPRLMGGEFEPCLAGLGNLKRKCQVFPVKYTSFIS